MINKEKLIQELIDIFESYDLVKRVWLFGSVARNEMKELSDVDLLVEFEGTDYLFDYLDLKEEIETVTNIACRILDYKKYKRLPLYTFDPVGLRKKLYENVTRDREFIYERDK